MVAEEFRALENDAALFDLDVPCNHMTFCFEEKKYGAVLFGQTLEISLTFAYD